MRRSTTNAGRNMSRRTRRQVVVVIFLKYLVVKRPGKLILELGGERSQHSAQVDICKAGKMLMRPSTVLFHQRLS